jgi:hypothetical protein
VGGESGSEGAEVLKAVVGGGAAPKGDLWKWVCGTPERRALIRTAMFDMAQVM